LPGWLSTPRVWEIWPYLVSGATLYIPDPAIRNVAAQNGSADIHTVSPPVDAYARMLIETIQYVNDQDVERCAVQGVVSFFAASAENVGLCSICKSTQLLVGDK
jgi:hypothetical protein